MTRSKRAKEKEKAAPQPLAWWSRIQIRLDPAQQREIIGLALFALGALLLLSLLHITPGIFGEPLSQLLRTLFGWGAFALPLFAFLAGAFLLRRGEPIKVTMTWGRIFAAEIFFAALLALAHLLTPAASQAALAENGDGGGFIGWALSGFLASAIGATGAGLIYLAIALFTLPAVIGLSTTHLQKWSASLAHRAAQTKTAATKTQIAAAKADSAASLKTKPAPAPAPATMARAPTTTPAVAAPTRPVFGVKPPTKSAASAQQLILTPRNRPRRRGSALPGIDLLASENESKYGEVDAKHKGDVIVETLNHFGIPVKIVEINAGPTITQFGLEPGFVERRGSDGQMRQRKISVNRIAALQHDLELALAAAPIRIETPVPGRPIVGIEVPNQSIAVVSLRGVMESDAFKKKKSSLKIALGRDVSGAPNVADLATMPHLLIAGATGSGKSVCINASIACLLFNNSPDELRLIMVDPKRVELVNFNGIPHLLGPVVVDMDEVVACLRWLTREMDNRFRLFAKTGVRNIDAYNEKAAKTEVDTMPYIVAFIDELADLMLAAPEETEKLLTRLAQMARATGIHLVIATQRPSVDVVTGLIKANFPARISFAVTSGVDSRVVLDTPGAEKLLGKGDMLYMASDSSKLLRLQGCFVSDDELARLVHFWREKAITDLRDIAHEAPWKNLSSDAKENGGDALVEQATELVRQFDRTSISFLQRKLGIGYPRAARLMDQLEEQGVVGPDEGGGKSRVVLMHGMHVKESETELEEGSKKKR